MKKILFSVLCFSFVCSFAWAAEQTPALTPATQTTVQDNAQRKALFKARRKQIRKLVKQYKKAPAAQNPAIKAELEKLVSVQVDEGFVALQEYIDQERAKLDNLEQKIKADKSQLEDFKAKRVDDLLSGAAKQKHKAAKKAWKAQIKEVKNRFR